MEAPISTTQELQRFGLIGLTERESSIAKKQLTFGTYPMNAFRFEWLPPLEKRVEYKIGTTYDLDYRYPYDIVDIPLNLPEIPHFDFNRKPQNDLIMSPMSKNTFMDDHFLYPTEGRQRINFFRQIRNQTRIINEKPRPDRKPPKPPATAEPNSGNFPSYWFGKDNLRKYQRPDFVKGEELEFAESQDRFPPECRENATFSAHDLVDNKQIKEQITIKEKLCALTAPWEQDHFDLLPAAKKCEEKSKLKLQAKPSWSQAQETQEAQDQSNSESKICWKESPTMQEKNDTWYLDTEFLTCGKSVPPKKRTCKDAPQEEGDEDEIEILQM